MNYFDIPEMNFERNDAFILTLIAAFILNAAVNMFRESATANKLDEVADEVRQLNFKLEDNDSDYDSESDIEPEQLFTFQFASGGYAHYFGDPDGDFVLVLPEDTLRGGTIIEATVGHVTRSNIHGSPIITYIDFHGSRRTYVLPEYAGRRFCDFINSKL
jgi:hypothetical protein